MHVTKDRVPVKMAAPGAVARQQPGFGDAAGYAGISGEYFSLDAGTDIAPLLMGLDGDSCHSPHWGYLMVSVEGEAMRPVTWVTIEEVASGEWGIGGKAMRTGDVAGMRAAPSLQ